MKQSVLKHIIHLNSSVRTGLIMLDKLADDSILFLVNKEYKLIGSLTDGDIRRGLINGLNLESNLQGICTTKP